MKLEKGKTRHTNLQSIHLPKTGRGRLQESWLSRETRLRQRSCPANSPRPRQRSPCCSDLIRGSLQIQENYQELFGCWGNVHWTDHFLRKDCLFANWKHFANRDDSRGNFDFQRRVQKRRPWKVRKKIRHLCDHYCSQRGWTQDQNQVAIRSQKDHWCRVQSHDWSNWSWWKKRETNS